MKSLLIAWDFNGVLNAMGGEASAGLTQLQAHGAEQIVVSSTMPGEIEQYLRKHGLDVFFEQVYGYALTQVEWVGDAAWMKAQSLGHHIRKFGPYERMLIIGDSDSDIRAGQQEGMETCLFSKDAPGFETTADHVAHSMDDVVKLVVGD